MPVIHSHLDTQSVQYSQRGEFMRTQVAHFRQLERKVAAVAEATTTRYKKRGLLMPRERLARLLDVGAPFLELSTLAGYKMYDDNDGSGAGGGCIAGIGTVSGIRCLVRVDDFAVKGGTICPMGVEKGLRLQHIALENKLPLVTLAQSGGANLSYATEVFARGGTGFANQARLSAAGIPQITVVHGSATAGGAYQPGLSDYVVMVRDQARMYLAGPPLLKAATGEIATEEELGGAWLHTEAAGTGDYLAENDHDGIDKAREILANLPWNQQRPVREEITYAQPLYSPDELLGVVPVDPKTPYDVREIIARIADGSVFLDFKSEFDQHTVCGHIAIEGFSCGVIGNNGPITAKGAAKAAQFIQLCEQTNVSLLFLHNTTGFMVGTQAEQSGIIKHGAKMIQAVANAKTPKISIVVGGSYGAGNYAMCGRGFDPRFLFAWPNSRTAVMGGEQAGKVMRMVKQAKMQQVGGVNEQALNELEQNTAAMITAGSTAVACSARLWDDGLIDPCETRVLLGFLLDICHEADSRALRSSSFGVSRF